LFILEGFAKKKLTKKAKFIDTLQLKKRRFSFEIKKVLNPTERFKKI